MKCTPIDQKQLPDGIAFQKEDFIKYNAYLKADNYTNVIKMLQDRITEPDGKNKKIKDLIIRMLHQCKSSTIKADIDGCIPSL